MERETAVGLPSLWFVLCRLLGPIFRAVPGLSAVLYPVRIRNAPGCHLRLGGPAFSFCRRYPDKFALWMRSMSVSC